MATGTHIVVTVKSSKTHLARLLSLVKLNFTFYHSLILQYIHLSKSLASVMRKNKTFSVDCHSFPVADPGGDGVGYIPFHQPFSTMLWMKKLFL